MAPESAGPDPAELRRHGLRLLARCTEKLAKLSPGKQLEYLQQLHAKSPDKFDALVEVHDESELEEALNAGAKLVGVNNRDLKTFEVDVETSLRLAELIPDDCVFIVESGIHGRADIDRLLKAGADAFLIGEHFLTAADPAAAIRGLS